MRIALATSGLWQLRQEVELMTGATACRLSPFMGSVDAIAGWGHKPTAARARHIANTRGIPYIAFEDGFIRSVNPGNSEKPLSLVMDRTGIYYDARQPSDLEALIRKRASTPQPLAQIRQAMDLLRTSRLSKYNNSTIQDVTSLGLRANRPEDRVLVVDQTRGDASIEGALATGDTFNEMLVAAVEENPGAEILVRVHPETMMGRKLGHFSKESLQELCVSNPAVAKALQSGLLRLTPEPVNPWALLEVCQKIHCVASQFGFEGVLAGCEVHSFGASFYSGWGITVDRSQRISGKGVVSSLEELFAAVYFDYIRYLQREEKFLIEIEDAVELMLMRVGACQGQGRV
jgi:capsule polysaccharide export protein KpsC/LpsZ